MSPGMVGPTGWSCCGGQWEWGWGGLAPLPAPRLVLHGVGEHHWGSQHPSAPPAPRRAALAVSGRQRMLRGAPTAVRVKGGDDTRERDAGMPWKAGPGQTQQAGPRHVPVWGAGGSRLLCLSSPSCLWLVVHPSLRPHPGSLGCKSPAMAVRDPQHAKVSGEHTGPPCRAALVPSGTAVGTRAPAPEGCAVRTGVCLGFTPKVQS